jgi:predicted MFS family arabinose efflux permease
VAGGRTLIASAFALSTPADLRSAVMSLRAATMQFGYFAGSIAGGAALTVGGYGALGATMGLFFLAAAWYASPGFAAARRGLAVRVPRWYASHDGLSAPRPARGSR